MKAGFTSSEGWYSAWPPNPPIPPISIYHILQGHNLSPLSTSLCVEGLLSPARGGWQQSHHHISESLEKGELEYIFFWTVMRLNFFFSPIKGHLKSAWMVSACPSELKKQTSQRKNIVLLLPLEGHQFGLHSILLFNILNILWLSHGRQSNTTAF